MGGRQPVEGAYTPECKAAAVGLVVKTWVGRWRWPRMSSGSIFGILTGA